MAKTRSMYKCVILLALIASHAILSAEGRYIKSMNKKDASAVEKKSQRKTAKQGDSSINMHQSPAEGKEDFQPTQPSGHISVSAENTVAPKEKIFPPMSFIESAAVDKDDFRPTTPGNSPGVGHKLAEDEDEESKVVGDDYSLSAKHPTGVQTDFRPTVPGHSPGVGHALSNKNGEPKA